MADNITPDPPAPRDPMEAARWSHTRLRRRLMDGHHKTDVETRRREHMGSVRSAGQGPIDLSANPFRVINRERSVLYSRAPDVRSSGSAAGLIGEGGILEESGIWSTMTRFQSWVLGCREYLLRLSVADSALNFRPVPPDLVLAASSPDSPDLPVRVAELRLRTKPGGSDQWWCWDVLDISDPGFPVYRVVEARHDDYPAADLSAVYLSTTDNPDGDFSGENYPYRRADGTPVLPYVLYHAERLGDRLWDAHEEIELLEGSLNLAVLLGFWVHSMRDASWPQRWGVNVQPAGLEI